MRVRIVTWGGGGNEPPAVAVADELATRGHDVHLAGYHDQAERLARHGRFAPLRRSADTFRAAVATLRNSGGPDDAGLMATLTDDVWCARAHTGDLADLPPVDVTVVDCLMVGALLALNGQPTVTLVHSAAGALLPPGGPLESLLALRIGEPVWDVWSRGPTVVASIPDLDPLPTRVPGTFVGPLVPARPSSGWRAPWPDTDPRPFAVVSFSSGYAWDQTSRLRRTLDGLGGRYRTLALTGHYPVTAAGDEDVRRVVPHAEVLPGASAVVTHAGHGTLLAALAHGVPVVCLPNLAADQPALAARVADLGAGIALDGEHASAADIGAAVDEVVGDPRYRAAARDLAHVIAGHPGVSAAADVVERAAQNAGHGMDG